MKSIAATIALIFLASAAPLLAQDKPTELTLWASWVDLQGSNDLNDGFATEFESGEGGGVTINKYLSPRVSLEAGASLLKADATLAFPDVEPLSLGTVDLTPITLGVQFHFMGQGRIDPYVAAGAAYVIAEELKSDDLAAVGLGTIDIDDGVTYYANAGIGFMMTPSFGLALDARYIPFKPTTTSSTTAGEEDLELSPLVVSAGLRLRF